MTESTKQKSQPTSQPESEPQPSRLERLMRLVARFERLLWDAVGVILLALALMTLLALVAPQLAGGILDWWVQALKLWFGWGSLWLALFIGAAGFWMLLRRHLMEMPKTPWGSVLALEAAAFCSLALLAELGGISLERADQGLDGGRVGWGLAELLRLLLKPVGLSGSFWMVGLLSIAFGVFLLLGLGVGSFWASWLRRAVHADSQHLTTVVEAGPAISEAPLQGSLAPSPGEIARKKASSLPPQYRKNFRLEPDTQQKSATLQPRDERLPGLDLLMNEQSARPDERHINLTAGLIEKTLAEFGIPAKVVGFRVGPTVTQFAVEPGFLEKEKAGNEGDVNRMKVRVAQISALQRDLNLALAAERLRIEAPVPGRPYVGIEVPNSRTTIVRLRPVLESDVFSKMGSPLAIGLGRDVSGQPVVADLARMPHLLVAGTTGSGKSVCIAALTVCLVMNNTPEDLRLVMVDPKMVELVRFNGLPHLLGKVETELERILGVLRWTVAEMDRRYKLLEASRSRNIDSYNRKAHRRKGEQPLPRIVVMIDELADLMMSAPDQTEHNLVRLAQLARATGIHLVVATQRPSTDVVTGLIKANFPARIAFTVASMVDSRVILDTVGAESLLGRGDMLFLPPEAPAPIRSQGAMVTDQEIERIITFWQKVIPPPVGPQLAPWEEMMQEELVQADRDGLVERAVAVVRETQKASASLLQRRLRIGYPRAARLIDQLEELGIVGPATAGRDREVLVSPDKGSADRDEFGD
ncbi:MAG TPA: DNA translocase FtsK [Anaerolineales bacterium]